MIACGGSLERRMHNWIVVRGGAPGRCSLGHLLNEKARSPVERAFSCFECPAGPHLESGVSFELWPYLASGRFTPPVEPYPAAPNLATRVSVRLELTSHADAKCSSRPPACRRQSNARISPVTAVYCRGFNKTAVPDQSESLVDCQATIRQSPSFCTQTSVKRTPKSSFRPCVDTLNRAVPVTTPDEP